METRKREIVIRTAIHTVSAGGTVRPSGAVQGGPVVTISAGGAERPSGALRRLPQIIMRRNNEHSF